MEEGQCLLWAEGEYWKRPLKVGRELCWPRGEQPVGELGELTLDMLFLTQVPVGSDSQNVVQPPFQQPMLVPANQSVQGGLPAGGVPVYYSMIPPAQQNGTR